MYKYIYAYNMQIYAKNMHKICTKIDKICKKKYARNMQKYGRNMQTYASICRAVTGSYCRWNMQKYANYMQCICKNMKNMQSFAYATYATICTPTFLMLLESESESKAWCHSIKLLSSLELLEPQSEKSVLQLECVNYLHNFAFLHCHCHCVKCQCALCITKTSTKIHCHKSLVSRCINLAQCCIEVWNLEVV